MTATDIRDAGIDEVEALAVDVLRWMLAAARDTGGDGLGWPEKPSDDEPESMLYCGTAGVVPVLLEAWRHFGDDSFADTALRDGLQRDRQRRLLRRCLAGSAQADPVRDR